MQTRTRNEKILLALLLGIIFVGGNYFGYEWLSDKQSADTMAYLQLRVDRVQAEADLQQADQWAKRKEWIGANEPPLGEEGAAKAQVLEYVQKGSREHHLEILEQSLGDVQKGAAGTKVNVSVKIKGSMQDLCQWLSDVQKPKNFFAVSNFQLKADPDQKSMICTLQLARYFKEGS